MLRHAFVGLALTCTIARADVSTPYAVPDFMSQPPPVPPGAAGKAVWKLDLAEALTIALHQNTGAVVERQSARIARLGIDVAKGEFEPVVSAYGDHSSADTPPTTIQIGMLGTIITNRQEDWNLALSAKLPTGAQAQVAFGNTRTDSNAMNVVDPLLYNTSVTATISQPILRGFSTDLVVPRADIIRAKITSERERAQLEVTAASIVQTTEDAYWDLVLALYSYDLDVQSQKRADDQLALTKRQIAAGTLPPSDLIAAESTLAQRKLAVVQAEQAVDATSDALRSAMNLPRDQWSQPILPTELPSFTADAASAEQALQLAIEHRPELAQYDLDVQSAILSVRQAENAKLPSINVGVTGGLYGLDPSYAGALDGIGKHNATGYTVSLNFSWTPLQKATAANAAISRANERIATAHRDQALQDTWFAVRDAVRNQSSTERQVLAAAEFRRLATENLEVEQRKFGEGTSSNFFIAQRQEDLANAQLAELSAVLSHKKANAALLRAEGTLLAERHVVLE